MQYQKRFYRTISAKDLVQFSVQVKESDLFIMASRNLSDETEKELKKERYLLEKYIEEHPDFYLSFKPLPCDEDAPDIVKMMSQASFLCDVGPMATVAGAIAEMIGNHLLQFTDQIIIENGGDIFLKTKKERLISIFAGNSPFSMRIGIKVKPRDTCFGIATSSGTVGHSTSKGKANSVTVLCPTATLADGLATCICNLIGDDDFSMLKNNIKNFPFLDGILVIKDKDLFAWGDIEIIETR